MENVYTLSGKYQEFSNQYDSLSAQLDEIYEMNGGEITVETTEVEELMGQIAKLQDSVLEDIISNSDAYAEVALNKAAQRKVLEAELKAYKEEQKKVIDRYNAKIARLQRSEDFWKENFDIAMKVNRTEKIGGAKTDHLHSIYYSTTRSVNVDEPTILAPYADEIAVLSSKLPAWLKIGTTINKTELKKEEVLPEGACIVENQSIVIR